MPIPQLAAIIDSEELESLQMTVTDLFNQFIKPIDNVRSQAWPNNIRFSQNQDSRNNFQTSNTEVFESRIHAFYRILSFPVVGNNSFYNPGFVPAQLDQSENKSRVRVAFEQNTNLSTWLQDREQQCLNKKNIFFKQDLKSCLNAILLKYCPPMTLFSNSAPFQMDAQKFTISDRISELEKLSEANPDIKQQIMQSGFSLEISQKQLKPFVVDPRIEIVVTPDYRQICAPFLPDKNSCQIDKNVYLQRSGLELILRQRLSDTTGSTLFLAQAEQILNQKTSPIDATTLSSFSLVDSLQAISQENKLDNSIKEILNNISDYQLTIINQLTKYLKFCIKKLVNAIKIIDQAKFQINWFPIPSKDGPITGSVGAKLSSFGLRNSTISSIEQKISELKIKKLNAQRDRFDFADIGLFLSPFQGNNSLENISDYEEQISILERKKNKISDIAFFSLSEVEMLVGEVAGAGLIDIISIYLSLWSLDLNTLIHLLDQDSFDRLIVYNPQFLAIEQVQNRKNSGQQLNIEQVLQNMQNMLFNILSYADKVFQGYLFSNI